MVKIQEYDYDNRNVPDLSSYSTWIITTIKWKYNFLFKTECI